MNAETDTVLAPEKASVRVAPRDLKETDEAFVVDSWCRSWRLSNTARKTSGPSYHALFRELVLDGILADPATRFLVLGLEEDIDEIAGWICYAPGVVPTVHYAFVRKRTRDGRELRRAGLLGAMIHLAGVRDALVYTFRPSERTHPRDNRTIGVESALLVAAKERGIDAIYRSAIEYLKRTRGR